jgi:hypothetical protein
MKDEVKRQRKLLRPSFCYEQNGKGIKKFNRRIVRKKLKQLDKKGLWQNDPHFG